MRLKLYLTMALVAVSPPYDIPAIPARSWAAALGLDDPDHNGARRVNDATGWLAEHNFLLSERRRGTPGRIRMLSQSGNGTPYTRPIVTDRYVQLPLGLWEQGWIGRLSGTALGLLIVLLDMQSGRAEPQWIAPSQARLRYDLSPDTWTKGIHELEALGLVTLRKRSQGDFSTSADSATLTGSTTSCSTTQKRLSGRQHVADGELPPPDQGQAGDGRPSPGPGQR